MDISSGFGALDIHGAAEKVVAHSNSGDIKVKGAYRVSAPLPVERDEPALAALPRLVFNFNKREHGRLRMLIDHLNNLPG